MERTFLSGIWLGVAIALLISTVMIMVMANNYTNDIERRKEEVCAHALAEYRPDIDLAGACVVNGKVQYYLRSY